MPSGSANSRRRYGAGTPARGAPTTPEAIHSAPDHSAGSSRPISQAAGSLHAVGSSAPAVQTRAFHHTRAREESGVPP